MVVSPAFNRCSPSSYRALLKFSSQLNYTMQACNGMAFIQRWTLILSTSSV